MGTRGLGDWKFADETLCVGRLIDSLSVTDGFAKDRVNQQATAFIDTIRERKNRKTVSGFQGLMEDYNLSSEEGRALLCLAEALLRVPDAATADFLIQDKIAENDWDRLFGKSMDMLGKVSGAGLKLTQSVIGSMVGRLGMPVIRKACMQALTIMGRTFVLGRSIDEALRLAEKEEQKGYTYSFDMLGEAARTYADADIYFDNYLDALHEIAANYDDGDTDADPLLRPGISVKLSALHPRFQQHKREECLPLLRERLLELARLAAENRINLTVDAEEADRLDLSLDIIEPVLLDPVVRKWEGFGLALQAYQKRAYPLLEYLLEKYSTRKSRLPIRLVKGAYWDTEIKHAQVKGYPDFPVYSRKSHTDVSFLACSKFLLDHRRSFIPMIGTHNAHTVASVIDMAGANKSGFCFQRLHGMGDSLFTQVLEEDIPCSIYAPIGEHKDLLAYLVRRLLENGANSSFVYKLHNPDISVETLCEDPAQKARENGMTPNPAIAKPRDIFGDDRENSAGEDLSRLPVIEDLETVLQQMPLVDARRPLLPFFGGKTFGAKNPQNLVYSPANSDQLVGKVVYATKEYVHEACKVLREGQRKWADKPVRVRAETLKTFADLLVENRKTLLQYCIHEAGKTIADAVDELREAEDFCRYYAAQAIENFDKPVVLPGPTGEHNTLGYEGRGIVACISPWNFPAAIFTGQIVAALVTGNAVLAKPAEQTPCIARYLINLMIQAGVPEDVIAYLPGDGTLGQQIVEHEQVDMVVFTGSTAAAKSIQRSLADNDRPIVPLIAETGGINAMIVDSTSLSEQVCDDVLYSAFGSAGQRCSALRVLCLQNDVADTVLKMLTGAFETLEVGDPSKASTDIGPIIDQDARHQLIRYRAVAKGFSKILAEGEVSASAHSSGFYFKPLILEVDNLSNIETEVFGPVLHVYRYEADELDQVIKDINAMGYGLTFGVHSRISKTQQKLAHAISAGNIYINRTMTGAVVGSQPFGGRGHSGTGPKAGGSDYLKRFVHEKVVSNNIAALGGNMDLINLDSDDE